ncbi:hypothetical protein [Cupriavidus pampae]|uniref:Muconolactone isomerase domain-containing protein n=1 Tax=Cupriavidus pampae TaxID=659251 RepID=A0ABN7ZAN3_9BURK|nr:hypothetical protein [Cupriavidus pampae]CAG9183043.1 hypothetical protein LMG32289_05258 [Cupriavidus pampae]
MQFLVLVSRTSPAPQNPPTAADREAESEVIRHLYVDGVVRQIWLRGDGGAAVLAEADDAERLVRAFSALPLVKSGFLQPPQVIELKPYSGFGPRAA